MNSDTLFLDQSFKKAALISGAFSLVYILVNLFAIGGETFVKALNDNLTIPLAILTVYFSFRLWQQVGSSPKSRFLWRYMIVGWISWTIAEILWAIFSFSGKEIPYPSWADLFWLLGYIPMGLGLFRRARSLAVKPTSGQAIIIWGLMLGTVLFSLVLIIFPAIQNLTPESLVETTLNIIYPIFDLILLVIILYLSFAYEQGSYGFGWRLLLVGFFIHHFANLIFSVISTFDLYYPEGHLNLVSTLGTDVPYNLSYLFWILGLYLLRRLLREHQPFILDTLPKLVPNTQILIFTKNDGTIFDASRNFYRWHGREEIRGKTLGEALGLTHQAEAAINENIRLTKKLVDRSVRIAQPSGEIQEGWLCGMAIVTSQGEYSGANYLLRMVSPAGVLDNNLSDSEKSVARFLLNQNLCVETRQIRQLLLEYYLAQIKLLYNLAFQEGGAALTQSLLDELQAVAQKHSWPLLFKPQAILEQADYPLDLLRMALPVFLETASLYVTEITDEELVRTQLQTLKSQMGEALHQNVAQFSVI
jgi:hypothetical protein